MFLLLFHAITNGILLKNVWILCFNKKNVDMQVICVHNNSDAGLLGKLTKLEDQHKITLIDNGRANMGAAFARNRGLERVEKDTVMSEFASEHDLPYIAGTWEELCEQGLIDKENLYWNDGLFFSIKTNEDAVRYLPDIIEGNSVPELTSFDAYKWRSGLGAYFFGQCTAQKNADGKWSYTVGQEAIS